MLGTSRKSVLGNIVGGEPRERVEATVATTVCGIRDGVEIVRVHDVKEICKLQRLQIEYIEVNYG